MGRRVAGGTPSRREAPMPALFVRGVHAVYGHKEPGWIRASCRSNPGEAKFRGRILELTSTHASPLEGRPSSQERARYTLS
eukprot:721002-Pleurochrysis_carterae.AAC.1